MPGKPKLPSATLQLACLALGVLSICLSACSSSFEQPPAPPNAFQWVARDSEYKRLDLGTQKQIRQTPLDCYTAFRFSWLVGDVRAAFEMLTPSAKRELAANVLGYVVLVDALAAETFDIRKGFLNTNGVGEIEQLADAFSELLRERGVTSVSELYNKHYQADPEQLSFDDRRRQHRETLIRMTDDITPLDLFVDHTIWTVRNNLPDNNQNRAVLVRLGMLYGRIVDIEEDEDSANGWQKLGDFGPDYEVQFLRDQGGWLIDQAIPEGYYLRWGGRYRDLNGTQYER